MMRTSFITTITVVTVIEYCVVISNSNSHLKQNRKNEYQISFIISKTMFVDKY